MYPRYKSKFGYQIDDDQIDSYGVDHSGFSTRDEVAYQLARNEKENSLMQQHNNQSLAKNHPQYGTNFWGDSANNYGFGNNNISQNIENMSSPTPQTMSVPQQQTSNDPNCYIEFDGNNVNLYKYGQYDGNRLQNGQLQQNLSGQSGDDNHQSSIHQNVTNHGPIPEGTYLADQNQRQSLTFKDATVKLGEKLGISTNQKSNWSGNPISWGTKRVWLRPDTNTNTYGRSGFSIHGGLIKGSAGCIDIPWQTDKLSNYLDNCQDSVPVYVKYPKKW